MRKNKKKKERTFFKDFKAFITKGNVVDLAVAVVIGGAFNKIVTGFVNHIIMPVLGYFTKNATFADMKWCIREEFVENEAGELVDQSTYVEYGAFIQAIIDFLIIAFCIFMMLRVLTKLRNRFDRINEQLHSEEQKKKEAELKAAEEAKAAAEAAAAEAAAAKEQAVKDAEIKTAKTLEEIVALLGKIAEK